MSIGTIALNVLKYASQGAAIVNVATSAATYDKVKKIDEKVDNVSCNVNGIRREQIEARDRNNALLEYAKSNNAMLLNTTSIVQQFAQPQIVPAPPQSQVVLTAAPTQPVQQVATPQPVQQAAPQTVQITQEQLTAMCNNAAMNAINAANNAAADNSKKNK